MRMHARSPIHGHLLIQKSRAEDTGNCEELLDAAKPGDTWIMENQMEKKMENEMETGIP